MIVATRYLVCFFCLIACASCVCQNAPDSTKLRLFINCNWCYQDYMRTEITFVDYVVNLDDADVDLLITDIATGSGGREYVLRFTGHKALGGLSDTLQYVANGISTEDEVRKGLAQTVKLGLVRYLARTSQSQSIVISCDSVSCSVDAGEGNSTTDPWKAWVFNIGANFNMNGQSVSQSGGLGVNLNAGKTTEKIKLNFSTHAGYSEQRYQYDGEKYTYIQRNQRFAAQVIPRLTDQWSLGFFGSLGHSDFDNDDLSGDGSVAVEYDFYPYSDSQTKSLAIGYYAGVSYYNFHELTIYGKMEDVIPNHMLKMSYSITRPWGSISCSINSSQFLDDLKKYSYGGFVSLDARIWKGLSISTFLNYDVIRNQINIPATGATEEEILLQQQVLATNYNFYSYFGIGYRFGSIYNNVVNPRFELGGGNFFF